jgi:hypothetical protein
MMTLQPGKRGYKSGLRRLGLFYRGQPGGNTEAGAPTAEALDLISTWGPMKGALTNKTSRQDAKYRQARNEEIPGFLGVLCGTLRLCETLWAKLRSSGMRP